MRDQHVADKVPITLVFKWPSMADGLTRSPLMNRRWLAPLLNVEPWLLWAMSHVYEESDQNAIYPFI